jgi:hypothetical protein
VCVAHGCEHVWERQLLQLVVSLDRETCPSVTSSSLEYVGSGTLAAVVVWLLHCTRAHMALCSSTSLTSTAACMLQTISGAAPSHQLLF